MTLLDILDYRAWKPVAVTAGAIVVVLGVTFGAGYWQGTKRNQAKVTQSENAANVAKGEADALKRQAEAKDQAIAAKDAGLEESRAEVARKVAQLESLRKQYSSHVQPHPIPIVEPIPTGVVDLSPLVAKQDEVIMAQGVFIAGLESKVIDLSQSRDMWKEAEAARSREVAGLRIALEAQKSLTKNALWRGRFQGFAIGLGSGYVIGRLQR